MSNLVITISREFGSGGRLVGEKLAKELDIAYYDRSIIQMAAEKSGLSPHFIEKSEERISNSFLFNLASTTYTSFRTFTQYDTPVNDKTFFAQSSVIREIAEYESCVIVGRCADYILREHDNLVRVFIRSTPEARVKRAVEEYGMESGEAASKIKKIDKGRANYYKFYTGESWGDIKIFDLIINTAFTGVDGAVSTVLAAINGRNKK